MDNCGKGSNLSFNMQVNGNLCYIYLLLVSITYALVYLLTCKFLLDIFELFFFCTCRILFVPSYIFISAPSYEHSIKKD